MPYRMMMTLASGDQRTLDATVDGIVETANRKGASVAGPHAKPTKTLQVPLSTSLDGEKTSRQWSYTVFIRELEIVGAESVCEAVMTAAHHESIDVDLTIETVSPQHA